MAVASIKRYNGLPVSNLTRRVDDSTLGATCGKTGSNISEKTLLSARPGLRREEFAGQLITDVSKSNGSKIADCSPR